ncbi:MAG: hypothetical protein GF346_03400 [Candidatus Eisenbacteria bacterium]|nr:hypothetical protein [Candidatus Latescibacterota bacterium]MBD3301468.1 hypothetical protein [Candidatus Eisenbacteria bacterium]
MPAGLRTGYAAYLSDEDPPWLDRIDRFGTLRLYEPGEAECPVLPVLAACCIAGKCFVLSEADCAVQGGVWFPEHPDCEGVECPPIAAQEKTWGRVRADYR